jgi:SpoIIAA-like
MVEELPESGGAVIGFKMSGKLHDEDYKKFVPIVDAAIAQHGKARMLAQFHDFQGWDLQALWDDIKFATTHCTKLERIALVGDRKWEEWMAKVCRPFTMAKIEYFDSSNLDKAWAWLREGA